MVLLYVLYIDGTITSIYKHLKTLEKVVEHVYNPTWGKDKSNEKTKYEYHMIDVEYNEDEVIYLVKTDEKMSPEYFLANETDAKNKMKDILKEYDKIRVFCIPIVIDIQYERGFLFQQIKQQLSKGYFGLF